MKGPRPAHANRDPVRRCNVTAQRHRDSRVRGSRPLAHQTRSPCPQIASPARQPQPVAAVRVVGRVGRRRPCSRCSAPLVGSCGPRRRKLRRTGFRPGRTPDLRLTPQTRPFRPANTPPSPARRATRGNLTYCQAVAAHSDRTGDRAARCLSCAVPVPRMSRGGSTECRGDIRGAAGEETAVRLGPQAVSARLRAPRRATCVSGERGWSRVWVARRGGLRGVAGRATVGEWMCCPTT